MIALTTAQKDHLDGLIGQANLTSEQLFAGLKATPDTPDTFTPPGPRGHMAAYIDYLYQQDLTSAQRDNMWSVVQSVLSESRFA